MVNEEKEGPELLINGSRDGLFRDVELQLRSLS